MATNSTFDQVFFTNSGAEANEGAIKLARKWGSIHRAGAYGIISFDNGFHGLTLATTSLIMISKLIAPGIGLPDYPRNSA